jgi:hypothetical protein
MSYLTKLTQSGIFLVRYRTEIRDAGMPMPALVSSMLMPSYGYYKNKNFLSTLEGSEQGFSPEILTLPLLTSR